MAKKEQSKKGFTIIEVVLVLAIAGLIFLMVFVALPALQRSQRDTQRRQDYADFAAAISSYMTNNGGSLPADGTTSLSPSQYINKTGKDPNGKTYKIEVHNAKSYDDVPDQPTQPYVYLYAHADCSGTGSLGSKPAYSTKVGNKNFAVYGYLETGSFCQAF